MLAFSDHVKEHYSAPRNGGALPDADAVGESGALGLGAALKLMLRIDGESQTITGARFQAYGCGAAIAVASAITDLVTGRTLDQALALTPAGITMFLGGLPAENMYCAVLGYEALQAAIANYRDEARAEAESTTICKCFGVREDFVARTVRMNRLTTPFQVSCHTKAGGCCLAGFKQVETLLQRLNFEMVEEGLIAKTEAYRIGSAAPHVADLIPSGNAAAPNPIAVNLSAMRPALRPRPPAHLAPASSRAVKRNGTPEETLIEKAIEDIRPYLQRDGGDCELIEVEGNVVHVRLSGACVGCQMASVTLSGVQEKLARALNLPLRVVPVQ